jgi:hypothetical protein
VRPRVIICVSVVPVSAIDTARNGISRQAARCGANRDPAQASVANGASDRAAANRTQDGASQVRMSAASVSLGSGCCCHQGEGARRKQAGNLVQHDMLRAVPVLE